MGEVGEVELRARSPCRRRQRRFGVAVLAWRPGRASSPVPVAGEDLVAAELEGGAVVPFDASAHRGPSSPPGILGQHGDAIRNLHHVDTPLTRLALWRRRRTLAAEARRMGDDGDQHAGQLHVLGEHRLPLVLAAVLARARACRSAEVLRVLQLHLGRHGSWPRPPPVRRSVALRCRWRRADTTPSRTRDLGGRHLPALGGRADQHGARGGAGWRICPRNWPSPCCRRCPAPGPRTGCCSAWHRPARLRRFTFSSRRRVLRRRSWPGRCRCPAPSRGAWRSRSPCRRCRCAGRRSVRNSPSTAGLAPPAGAGGLRRQPAGQKPSVRPAAPCRKPRRLRFSMADPVHVALLRPATWRLRGWPRGCALVGGAAAQVAGHRGVDVGIARLAVGG
jgi:hypothetical protein